jgi:hypothetical protein
MSSTDLSFGTNNYMLNSYSIERKVAFHFRYIYVLAESAYLASDNSISSPMQDSMKKDSQPAGKLIENR